MRSGIERADRREIGLQARDDQLEDVFGIWKILESMRAKVAQCHAVGQAVRREPSRRIRQDHLATMSYGRDPCGTVDVDLNLFVSVEAIEMSSGHLSPRSAMARMTPSAMTPLAT